MRLTHRHYLIFFTLPFSLAWGVNGTWQGPGDAWTTGSNWSSNPTVPDDIATFTNNGAPTEAEINSGETVSINTINIVAGPYIIETEGTFNINGSGLTGLTNQVVISVDDGGFCFFNNNATAASGNFVLDDDAPNELVFEDNSNPANALIINNSIVTFNQTSAQTYAGTMSGTGIVNKTGFDLLTYTGDNSYTGRTRVDFGRLQIGNGGATGSLVGDIVNSSVVEFNRSGTLTYNGAISGEGTVEITGPGTVIFNGNNTYSGLTTISAGTLQLGNIGSLGSVTNNSTLIFNNTNSFNVSGNIAGTGSLTKNGSGTVVLNGTNNSYTGPTVINTGSLIIGDAAHPTAQLTGTSSITIGPGGTLGGAGTITTNIDNNGSISVAAPGTLTELFLIAELKLIGNLLNRARIDLTGPVVGNRFTITGNYSAQSSLTLSAALGIDNSPSDLFVIDGGTVSGTTDVTVVNNGGGGGITTGNGIMIIQAINGGTTSPDSFVLAAPVQAGAFQYFLFRGGLNDPAVENNWFLRSSINGVPQYRPEVALYSAAPGVAQSIVLDNVSTFHRRMGEQRLLTDEQQGGTWFRSFGRSLDRSWSGTVNPKFDGSIWGAQAGTDFLALSGMHHRERVGIYGNFAQANGHVKGFALGQKHYKAGHVKLNSLGGGAYWTHADTRGWYVDNVVQGNYFFGNAHSDIQSAKLRGYGLAASIESGYPIRLPAHLELEPQAQLIYNYEKISETHDDASTVHFDGVSALTSRAGIRFQHTAFDAWREYVLVNVWNSSVGRAPLVFADTTTIALKTGSTVLEMGLGAAGQIIKYLNFYTQVSYTISLDNKTQHGVFGNLGIRYNW